MRIKFNSDLPTPDLRNLTDEQILEMTQAIKDEEMSRTVRSLLHHVISGFETLILSPHKASDI